MFKKKIFYGMMAFILLIMSNVPAMADVQRFDFTDDDDVVYTAVPDSGRCGDDMVWDLNADGLLTISGSGSMHEYYEQKDVPWFRNNNSKAITGVKFSGDIETISNMAFYGTRIKSIELPQSVKEIGYSSIANCRLLESVTLPDDMKAITRYAFNCDISLTYVHLPANLQSIGQDAFMGCYSLENIKIPDSVSVIDKLAFDDCMNLKKIVLPENITSVKDGTFRTCDNLAEVFFSINLKTIEKDAFSDCFSLKKIILPDGLESIGEYAFNSSEISGEQTIYIPESVKTIGKNAINENIATIYGFKNSAAEKYAKENNIPFVAVTESMYSEEEYKKALSEQVEVIPEIPVETISPQINADVLEVTNSNGVINITVGGKAVVFEDAKPFVDKNDRTQIPIRAVAESLGAKVDWDGTERMATITKNDKVITIAIDNANLQVGNKTITMDTTAQIINERTYIPIRFVGEALGMKVNWESK